MGDNELNDGDLDSSSFSGWLSSIFSNSHLGMVLFNSSGELEKVNGAFGEMLGYEAIDLEGRRMEQFIHPLDEGRSFGKISQLFLEDGAPSFDIEIRYIARNEELVWANVNASSVFDQDSGTWKAFASIHDITSWKKDADLLDDLQRMANIGGWEYDLTREQLYWTGETYRIHEFPENASISIDQALDFYPSPYKEQVQQALQDAIYKEKPYELVLKLLSYKGNLKWVKAVGKIIKERGEVTKIKGTFRDITFSEELKMERDRLFNYAQDLIGILEPENHHIIYLNPAFYQKLGWGERDLIHKDFLEIVREEDRPKVAKRFETEQEVVFRPLEIRMNSKNGAFKWIQWRFSYDKENRRWYVIGRDVTRQKKAQTLLEQSEERYRSVFQSSPVPMFLQYDRMILEVNQPFVEMMGAIQEKELLDDDPMNFVHPDYQDLMLKKMEKTPHGKERKPVEEMKLIRMDGEEIDVEVQTARIKIKNQSCTQVVIRDVTEKKRLEQRLMDIVVQTQESERKRFSQDLHDGLGQILTAAKMYVGNLNESAQGEKKEIAEKAYELVEQAVQETRAVSHGLMPKVLEQGGLSDALVSIGNETGKSYRLDMEVAPNIDEDLIFPRVKFTAFRIAQEALNNITKHAKASAVKIKVATDENSLFLDISDNGQGFDVEKVKFSEGIGLNNLKRRAEFIGGDIAIHSSPGKGTQLSVQLPLGSS